MMTGLATEITERGVDPEIEGGTWSTRVTRTEGEMTGGTETERRMVTSETSWTRTGGITEIGAETGGEICVIITETGVGTGVSRGGAGAEIVIATITKDMKTVGNL